MAPEVILASLLDLTTLIGEVALAYQKATDNQITDQDWADLRARLDATNAAWEDLERAL